MDTPSLPATKIDVLIPAYNVEATVDGAVKSILDQTIRDIRVIVVDDGSTDRTAEKLAELARSDSRLVVVRQPNGGIVDALNNGLTHCTSPFLARHDGDDIAFPDRLEKQLAYLNANPDCIAVGSNAFHIDETGRRTGSISSMKDPALADATRIPAEEPYLMHPFLLVRRASLDAIGGYRHVFHAEDADLYWRLSSIGRLHNMPDFMGEYRIHANSVSGKSVLNGRVQAINSQLAALSHRRRMNNLPDLTFPSGRMARFMEAKSLPRLMAIAEEELYPQELPQFRLAVAAKLLELESYRPYHLDSEDRLLIKKSLVEHAALLEPYDRQFLKRRQAKYVMTRVTKGDVTAASQFIRMPLLPPLSALVFHFIMRRVYKPWKW